MIRKKSWNRDNIIEKKKEEETIMKSMNSFEFIILIYVNNAFINNRERKNN